MKPKGAAYALTLLTALSLVGFSCGMPESTSRDSASLGAVKVSIQSRLLESLLRDRVREAESSRSPRSPGNRAIAFYDTWVTRIVDSEGVTVDSHTVSTFGEASTLSAPAGTGYTVHLEVYNSAMSATLPTVAGSTSGIEITSGMTSEARIVCLPVTTIPLVAGMPSADVVYEPYTNTLGFEVGTETWYTLNPAQDYILINTIFDTGTVPIWAIFDSAGLMFNGSGEMVGSPYEIGVNCEGTKPYYLAVLNYAGLRGEVSIGFDYGTAPADDAYEPNGTIRTATPLTANTSIAGILNPWNPDFYSLDVGVANSVLTVHLLNTGPSGDPILFWLVDSNGDDVGEGGESGVDFVRSLVTAGTYYLEIPGYVGTDYTLEWHI